MIINSIETYRDAGAKAGLASRRKDYALMNRMNDWKWRALKLESDEAHKTAAAEAYRLAYREASGIDNP